MTDAETLVRAPRLTRLEIQGFKSFLHRTVFAFEPGITAVVGPNGSGKSNVADAVRWVLGEQGQHALRVRKTEDVIFGGGESRAPAGLAEATLTFDNSDGWLPTEFAEVSVTRRAFRSGESQYLINGRRVRLKDVAFLTAGLGQSHVVVGQGLVDAALSLRAEERRGLFEHAADLAGLRLKIAEAERNLVETDANTARLDDLLLELAPRLRSLERAARQASEWRGLNDRLRELLGAHYRANLEIAHAALAEAQREAAAAAAAVGALAEDVAQLVAVTAAAEQQLAMARQQLAEHDERRAAGEDRLRRLVHERDLAAARGDALDKRRADMDDTRQGLVARVETVAGELRKLESDLRDLERQTGEARATTARHTRDLAARRALRVDVETRLASAAATLRDSERRATELDRRRAIRDERAGLLQAENERLSQAIAARAERIGAVAADLESADAAASADGTRDDVLVSALAELAETVETARSAVAAALEEVARQQRLLGEVSSRHELLRRMREDGVGLYGGVRAVLAAGRDGTLAGIRGAVGELLVAPPELETAIEVALGGHLQDIVVATWSDAEAAIAHLKRSAAGRATFQPLDTVRAREDEKVPIDCDELAGLRGVAAELVTVPDEMRHVVRALLGRTLVADDLPAARLALRRLPPGWSIVTLSGEIARAGGSVSGGSAPRESGLLSRERELRQLPRAIAARETRLAEARERVVGAESALRDLEERQRGAERERAVLSAAVAERRRQRERLTIWLQELRLEQEQATGRWERLRAEQEQLTTERGDLERDMLALATARHAAERNRDDAAAELDALAAAMAESDRVTAAEGRRLAGLEERLRAERRREAGLRAQERALAEELALRGERMAALEQERDSLANEFRTLAQDVATTGEEVSIATAAREPLRRAVAQQESAAARATASLQAARSALSERERERDRADFAVARAEQDLFVLRQRIGDELDVAIPEDVLGWESPSLALAGTEREAEITRLRERLRRVGYVGDDAVAEFERERTHHQFLQEQLADVEGAARSLRALLGELRQTMQDRFEETFARVASAFSEAFVTLFGGGQACLVLTGGDDGAEPGIDIIAQPPGKRLQSLALLSGGERALTAAALLFAILKVNPVPFCLLDEVDAALDEANVLRFREGLQELAEQMQIIVVTHNRGTIEIADTLYGVSMGSDGVSQVLSLRMAEAASVG
jgi:chromosome segregation protein